MDLSFKGAAKRLDDIDLPKLGHRLGVGEDEIHAVMDVESRGTGFDGAGRPRILFERHIFHRYLPKDKRAAAVAAGLASPKPGGYGKEGDQYFKLASAMKIDQRAALYACSWGLMQVMGFNHEAAGYRTVEAMVEAFTQDEEYHLEAAVNFILANKLDDDIRRHDWAGFAKGYNGTNYRINQYDTKLAARFAHWRKIRDTPWSPGATAQPVDAPKPVPAPQPSPKPQSPPAPAPVARGGIIAAIAAAVIAAGGSALAYFFPNLFGG